MTTTKQHSPEPWAVESKEHGARFYITAPKGGAVAILQGYGSAEMMAAAPLITEREANARRIVACVNACAGISTDALTGSRGDLADRLAARCKRLEEALALAVRYLEHPDVRVIPFALHVDAAAERARAALAAKGDE